ncbi:hypothetical protein NLI96_g9605 [Meripilus lineatus]|uniref:Uncharacterized protein n=1 Tax=Meripilus lineatus TaxID=2056292 RepID=A0AAD5UVA1_9APHY|nr:hypothetical protein NLI96_g9605 [Physisporinus lineatus]
MLDIQANDNDDAVFELPSIISQTPLECLVLTLPFGMFGQFLSNLPEVLPPSIKTITLDIRHRIQFEYMFGAETRSALRLVDEAFSKEKYGKLEHFIGGTAPPNGDTILEQVRAVLRDLMPHSYERGILWWGDIYGDPAFIGEKLTVQIPTHLSHVPNGPGSFSYISKRPQEYFVCSTDIFALSRHFVKME